MLSLQILFSLSPSAREGGLLQGRALGRVSLVSSLPPCLGIGHSEAHLPVPGKPLMEPNTVTSTPCDLGGLK